MNVSQQKEILRRVLDNEDIKTIENFMKQGGNLEHKLNNPRQTILDLAVEKNK